tara:strand:+ start:332 stop:844 length:513 start_codon:yes stop_codon:yes gene_type:complete
MKKSKIVILRGKVATGKTTALYNLRKRKEMKDWIIIDFNDLKRQFAYLGDEKRKEYGKKSLMAILKILMPSKVNILIDEMSEATLKKHISHSIRKYGYEVVTFQFTADLDASIEREAQRRKVVGKKPRGAKWVKKYHKMHEENADPKGIVIDTSKLNEKKVVKFILEELK